MARTVIKTTVTRPLYASESTYVSERTICGVDSTDVFEYYSESPFALPGGYTPQDIAAAVRAPTVAPRWRIWLLNPDDTVNALVPPTDLISGGNYSENYQSGQRRSLSFTLFDDDKTYGVGVNGIWFNTRIKLEMGLKMPDGGTAWITRGVYVVQNVEKSHSSNRDVISVSAADKWSLFDRASGTLESTYEIPRDQEIIPIVESILAMDRESGSPLDSLPPVVHPSFVGKRTQTSVTMNAGQTYAAILLELATQLSAEIYYNSTGHLTIMPYQETTRDDGKASLWDFKEEASEIDSLSFGFNSSEVFNRVIVIGSTANGQYHKAEASNEDPTSPTSVGRLGVRTAPIINDSNITTDYLAEERAQYELRKILILKTSVSFNTPINPFPTANGVITISSPHYGMLRQRFVIQSVSCSLDYSGTMSVSASSIWNLPFLTRAESGEDAALLGEGGERLW